MKDVATPAITLPALVVDPALKAPAREWAWEMAHQAFFTQDGSACNGRVLSQSYAAGNFTAYNNGFNFVDVAATFNDWITSSASCTVVMSEVNTTMNVGVAFDVAKGYVFVLK